MITEELDKAKLEVEAEKAEVQMRVAGGKTYSPQEGAQLEIKVAEMKAEKYVVTMQVIFSLIVFEDSLRYWHNPAYIPAKRMFLMVILESACLSICQCGRVSKCLYIHLCRKYQYFCVANSSYCLAAIVLKV